MPPLLLSKRIYKLFFSLFLFCLQIGYIESRLEEFILSNSSLRRRMDTDDKKHAHLPVKPGYMVLIIIAVLVGPWCLWITCFLFRASSQGYEAKLQKLLERKISSENAMKEAADALVKAK